MISAGCIGSSLPVVAHRQFVYHQTMNVESASADAAISAVAAAIGEPARACMLCCLLDARARTSTELAIVAEVSPSTASAHLQRLKSQRLVKVFAQGKHRYYSLEGANVAAALESLAVIGGGPRDPFVARTPNLLRAARTCYDHIAGTLGVGLHDRCKALGWLSPRARAGAAYDVTPAGAKALAALGIDVELCRKQRRRFAYACLDWSERRPHIAGAVGAALLNVALKRKWVIQDLDTRTLAITTLGRREMLARFGLRG
jgi:DNA-binding transcriptional ArsR family regulator